ncbi:MAG: magnesium transporter [Gammaproteobacteria bacterium]|nr:magnesium transporter [Gammaproteobacteria bacterium]
MGGVAGTQTLTITVRGLALGQVGKSNIRPLLRKELAISLLNGMLWAVVVGVVAYLWFDNHIISIIIGAAMIITLVSGAIAGAAIPLFLKQIGVDPAIAGGVLLTTVTDVIGFFSFLGLATLVLLG